MIKTSAQKLFHILHGDAGFGIAAVQYQPYLIGIVVQGPQGIIAYLHILDSRDKIHHPQESHYSTQIQHSKIQHAEHAGSIYNHIIIKQAQLLNQPPAIIRRNIIGLIQKLRRRHYIEADHAIAILGKAILQRYIRPAVHGFQYILDGAFNLNMQIISHITKLQIIIHQTHPVPLTCQL